MNKNIGQTLKTMSAVFLIVMGLLSIVVSFTIMSQDVLYGVMVLIISLFLLLLIAYLIYGFGHLIELTGANNALLERMVHPQETTPLERALEASKTECGDGIKPIFKDID